MGYLFSRQRPLNRDQVNKWQYQMSGAEAEDSPFGKKPSVTEVFWHAFRNL